MPMQSRIFIGFDIPVSVPNVLKFDKVNVVVKLPPLRPIRTRLRQVLHVGKCSSVLERIHPFPLFDCQLSSKRRTFYLDIGLDIHASRTKKNIQFTQDSLRSKTFCANFSNTFVSKLIRHDVEKN